MVAYDVVILPGYAQVETWRKRQAKLQPAGLFAQTVTTFDDWMRDLWELHGDGRALIDAAQRQIAMQLAFHVDGQSTPTSAIDFAEMAQLERVPQIEDAPEFTTGAALLAARCMRRTAGVSAFESALQASVEGRPLVDISEKERRFLECIASYKELIAAHGMIEMGEAISMLAARSGEVFPRQLTVLLPDAAPLSWIQEQFFASCPQLEVEFRPAPGSHGIDRAPQGIDVRFGFPSGRLAQPGLVADILRAWISKEAPSIANDLSDISEGAGTAVVACKDPLALFDAVSPSFADQDLCLRVQARVPFSQTDFGRTFLALYHGLNDKPWNPTPIQDVITSPFAGLSRKEALEVDTGIRQNRLIAYDDLMPWLRARSEPFSMLEEIVSDPDADVLLGVFEGMAQARAVQSPAWCAEQLAAISAARALTQAARCFQASMGLCASVLERVQVNVSAQVGNPDNRQVTFMPQFMAAQLGAGSASLVIATDLTSEDYRLSSKDDAAATLLAKLGLVEADGPLERARRAFAGMVNTASRSLFLVRPLADDNAAETFPSTVLEEFIDAYRPDPTATEDIDNRYRLPEYLQAGLLERGEEHLFANSVAQPSDARQAIEADVAWPEISHVPTGGAYDFSPKRKTSEGALLPLPCLSPSQVEAYLECPYRWYATRYLGASMVDEGFGALERGSFAHEVLEEFYRRFMQAGYAKVNEENLAKARELMGAVAAELANDQLQREPGSARYVPMTELEAREVIAVSRQLVDYLDFESKMLPTFHPAYLEYNIDADHPVEYGGALLVGKVDRIDVDDEGNAVIVDYKGSVKASHQIAGKTIEAPGKVQALMYAQAIKRQLGLNVVGAFYVSYGSTPSIAGACDARVIEAAHLPQVKVEKLRCTAQGADTDALNSDTPLAHLSFSDVLDVVEDKAALVVKRMGAAEVPARPADASACEYCPVGACPNRGA